MGGIVDIGAEGIDLYNGVLDGMGAKRRLGPSNHDGKPVDLIRT